MELSELTAYAAEKYNISEDFKWRQQAPGFSVLSHPSTGKWIALLIRNDAKGRAVQLCDIRCGNKMLSKDTEKYLSAPYSMKGDEWVGVRFDYVTDPKAVYRLIDRAYIFSGQNGCMIVLGSELTEREEKYKETALHFSGNTPPPKKNSIPEKIREMRRLYEYGYGSFQNTCRNFYIQGKFMEDYEDDAPWNGTFQKYFPTYHDLAAEQLRGYFTWRTAVRRGKYSEVCTSFAYIYIYELLNGIGAVSAEDSLEKLKAFEQGYIGSGIGDAGIRTYLSTWMTELAVVNDLPADTAKKYADHLMLKRDRAYHILKNHTDHTDEEVFEALFTFGGSKTLSSPVLKDQPDEGRRLFAAVWRKAAQSFRENGRKLFSLCFGECRPARWYPLRNAVYYERYSKEDRTYQLNECRTYILKNGEWSVKCYKQQSFDKKRFEGLLQETDRQLRIYLKEGHPLKEQPNNKWAAEYIEAAIEEDRAEKQKAAARKVTIRFDDLDRIRQDALHTQNSLLTEEEMAETAEPAAPVITEEPPSIQTELYTISEKAAPDEISASLSDRQLKILDMLLREQSVKSIIRSWGEMAEIFAEQLNEALFDEIGDTAVECDGEEISIIEDYREDIIRITGGKSE